MKSADRPNSVAVEVDGSNGPGTQVGTAQGSVLSDSIIYARSTMGNCWEHGDGTEK